MVIREADAAQVDFAAELADGPRPHIVAGNLPYAITGRLVQRTVEFAGAIDAAVFMVQKEVADRLAAAPDDDAYGALSVFTQAAFDVERVLVVKAGSFRPPPKVDSAVVLLTPMTPRRAEETPRFRDAVKRAFAARRKTLRNAWKGMYGLSPAELAERAQAAGIDLDARGETLAVEAFAAISKALVSRRYADAGSSSHTSRQSAARADRYAVSSSSRTSSSASRHASADARAFDRARFRSSRSIATDAATTCTTSSRAWRSSSMLGSRPRAWSEMLSAARAI
jgi:16S rRNA A1518/A1519 N6-dimethyltransferase RsmA/KsgA/DIM1 with predicted DNA glycosylase/AP lyase activity